MERIQVSLSADTSLDSALKVFSIMVASLNGSDVLDLKPTFVECWKAAMPFFKKYGIAVSLQKEAQNFIRSKMELYEDAAGLIHQIIKPVVADWVKDNKIPADRLAMLKDVNLLMKKDSAPALKRLSKAVATLGDHKIALLFLNDDDAFQGDEATYKKLLAYSDTLANKREVLAPAELFRIRKEAEEKKDKKTLDLIARYSELRKDWSANFKKALLHYVRKSGQPLVDVEDVKDYLKGLSVNNIVPGFEGKIDELGNYYTSEGKKLLSIPASKVTMNPKYDAKTDNAYVCSIDGQSGGGRIYTVDYRAGAKQESFGKVGDFIEEIEEHRKSWLKDLDSVDEKKQLLATITEVIYATSARVGNPQNGVGSEKTYGITTITAKHVKQGKDGSLIFAYPGKKGTPQHHVLKPNTAINKKVISIIKRCLSNKKPAETIFTVRGKPFHSNDVNRYIRALGIVPSCHKFRHVQGTKMALEILKKSPFGTGRGKEAPTQTAADKWLKEAMKEVGEKLHHQNGGVTTGATAISSYVSPEVLINWYHNLGLRTPKWVPKVGASD